MQHAPIPLVLSPVDVTADIKAVVSCAATSMNVQPVLATTMPAVPMKTELSVVSVTSDFPEMVLDVLM
jgi:hypothetical protein